MKKQILLMPQINSAQEIINQYLDDGWVVIPKTLTQTPEYGRWNPMIVVVLEKEIKETNETSN